MSQPDQSAEDNKKSAGGGGGPSGPGGFKRLTRKLQEKIGNVERTEMDEAFTNKSNAFDEHKKAIDDVVKKAVVVIQPDRELRKSQSLVPEGPNTYEMFAECLTRAQTAWAEQAPTLKILSTGFGKLGAEHRDYQQKAKQCLLPLEKFVEYHYDILKTERSVLQTKRINMDCAKTSVKSATSIDKLGKRTEEYEQTIKEFDEQADKTLKLLDMLPKREERHRRTVKSFLEIERDYHRKATKLLDDAIKEYETKLNPKGSSVRSSQHSGRAD